MLRLLIFGPQLSGKGTQAKNIAREYGLAHLSTGDLLRAIRANPETDPVIKAELGPVLDQGALYPDDKMTAVLCPELDKFAQGYILDGFPRTLNQAELLDEYMREHGQALTAALVLKLSRDEIMKRLEGRVRIEKRSDDNPEAIEKRLKLYETMTVPAIEFYRTQGLVIDINGEQTREAVFAEIKQKLDSFSKS